MEKNQTFVGTAEGMGTNGEGIVKKDGFTVFVPYLLPGERANIKILKVKGNVAYGKAEEILTPAEERVRPKCAAFFRCGGCQLQHCNYRMQLKVKTRTVQEALRKIGGISYNVPTCEKSDDQFAYRNKLQLPIGRQDGKNVIGFYAERSHRIIPIDDCPIHPEWVRPLIAATYNFMEKCGQDGYDEQTNEGLRHIVVREVEGKFLVTLVSTTAEIKGIDYFIQLLNGVFVEYSFYLNVNKSPTNVIFGNDFYLLKGQGTYTGKDCGISFEAGVKTFLQINGGVRGKLYHAALNLAVSSDKDVVIDCYAGGGLLTAMFARKCARAYGIEIVEEATACANLLAKRNKLEGKMSNLCGRVEDLLPEVLKKEPNATLVLDPPRAGIDRSVINAILSQDLQKIILISCNPATLARDLGLLTGTLTENEKGELIKTGKANGKYEVTYLQPFDMFPQTKHVETLVCLARRAN